jgi:hypothetical protein
LEATVAQSSAESVVSHVSAAVLHGLPVGQDQLARVHLTWDRSGHGKARRYVQVHGLPLAHDDVVDVAGYRTTSLAAYLEHIRPRYGIAQGRRTAALLDSRSESPGESMSRVVFFEHGIPMPTPQLRVYDHRGRFVGRSDFGWEEQRTLGEFDGRSKYGRLLLKPGQTPEDALFEEKQREDRLRDSGWQIVRWVWADLYAPAPLLGRLRRAFLRGRRD